MIIALAILSAIILGYGAGTGNRIAYGIGFWICTVIAVVAFFQLSLIGAFKLLGAMLLAVVLAWVISLSLRVGRGKKG